MKIAAFGRTAWLFKSIERCAAAGHTITSIVTAPSSPEYSATERDFETLAASLGCRFSVSSDPASAALREAAADAEAAISVNWPFLIGQDILHLFKRGVLNAHAGDLPRYRGNACPNWAILNKEKDITVSIHAMTGELDAGPVYAQKRIPLEPQTYVADVYQFMETHIPELFTVALEQLQSGRAAPAAHADAAAGLRCYPRLPIDGEIQWDRGADDIVRLVRASGVPFAGAYTHYHGKRLIVWRAKTGALAMPSVGVPCQVIHRDRASGEVHVLANPGVVILQEAGFHAGDHRAPAGLIASTRDRLGLHVSSCLEQLEERVRHLEERINNLPRG